MDDFGSILERDYGLGRAGKGRIGSRNGKTSNMDSSSRFSESFGRNKFGRNEFGGSFRGWNDRHSSPASAGYGGSYQGGGASYAVYDEVFSCNLHSTIPIFEDVFRVPSSRIKVSEMRDNDIFRGIPSLKKSNSRVTYEDIFGEPPDDFSGPFSFAEVKNATASSRTNSSLGTPRKEAEGTKIQPEFPQPVDTAALKRPEGSFLAMSSSFKQNGLENPPEKQPDEPCRAPDADDGNASTTMKPAKPMGNSFVSVEQVSLTTRPSEVPPPARIAPDRVDHEPYFETMQSDSGPPPQRSPPPLVPAQAPESEEVSATNRSSELLERVLKESSAHAELSIREKVLDWQKHNWAEVEKQKSSSTGSSPRSIQPSSKSRSETLIKLRAERVAIERIAAEVEAAAAEQAKLRAERAATEKVERDIMKESHRPSSPSIKGAESSDHATKKIEEIGARSKELEADVNESDDLGKVAESDVATSASELREEQAARSSGALEEAASTIIESSLHSSSGSKDPPLVDPQGMENAGDPSSSHKVGSIDKNKATDNTDSESIDVSIDSFTTNHTKKEEEAAPETPERLETTKKSNKSSNNSGEEGNGAGAGAGGDHEREAAAAKIDEEQQRAREEDARRARERSLVARITAEVRERAALEAKAKAEKAALDRKKENEQRRTKPRIIMEEVVAKELEDRAAPSSSSSMKGGGAGGARISLREQLEKERLSRLENASDAARTIDPAAAAADHAPAASTTAVDQAARIRAERSLVERMRAEAREREANARLERGREDRERERLERIDMARKRERERLERLEKERERERERLARELEREREIEREKDRVGLEEKAAKERAEAEAAAEAARLKMERAAVERANAEARARAERAAYEAAAKPPASATTARPTSVPKQRFGNSASMPSNATTSDNGGMRRTTSSTNLEGDRNSSSTSTFREGFKEFVGETPERRKARLERYQRTLNRAAQALAQKNKRDLELQSEQAERQRLAERLDSDIRRWSVGKDGNIRALLSTLQYVLWPESGWKQVSLTDLINPTAVKKAYRRATLCVHPDKMQQKNANVQQKYIAEKVFHILQVAWNKFISQETI